MEAKLMLPIPHAPAERRAATEYAARGAKARSIAGFQDHPMTDELLDAHRELEEILEEGGQAFRVANLPG